eukprot:TRINITY_DN10456_c0_g1_i3.p2 TRINITY_DN10456_c0_g1~~TRINITY_DN10456_c0_g1_i3.p2  ORF type:complete len:192 (+),score=23.73 TRINITY_DN10456_c0_g1_i3:832-1407(+)
MDSMARPVYGVGFVSDQGITSWVGTQGPPGPGYFHYVRPLNNFSVKGNGAMIRGLSYLILGNYNTVEGLYTQYVTHRPPFGSLDVPAQGSTTYYTSSSGIRVEGWALASQPGTFITVEIDGKALAYLPLNMSRPDVCSVYPGYSGCPLLVGFDGVVPTNGLDTTCPHLLTVYASSKLNIASRLGDRLIVPH